ncbi:MAG: NAD(+)/NADH kinase [Myxococcales bacterium]
MTTAAFIAKVGKAEAYALVAELRQYLAARGVVSLVEEHSGHVLGLPSVSNEEMARRSDLCIVLGGDGTLIHAAAVFAGRPVPILGVNLGSLGFMTEIPAAEVTEMLERVLLGDFKVEPRMKLRVRLHRAKSADGRPVVDAEVLNDVVINKGALARIADLQASIEGTYITTYKADGVIVSTPTGSTAYSLSAAGPIMYPTMHAVIITPICPHTLTQRPIVVPDDRQINLVLTSESAEMYLTLDGQSGVPMVPGDRVQIEQSPNRLLLIRNPKLDYFSILRQKLRWGER